MSLSMGANLTATGGLGAEPSAALGEPPSTTGGDGRGTVFPEDRLSWPPDASVRRPPPGRRDPRRPRQARPRGRPGARARGVRRSGDAPAGGAAHRVRRSSRPGDGAAYAQARRARRGERPDPRRVPAPLPRHDRPAPRGADRAALGEHPRPAPVPLPLAAPRPPHPDRRQGRRRDAGRPPARSHRRRHDPGRHRLARLALRGPVVRRVPALSLPRVHLAGRRLPPGPAGVAVGHGPRRQRRRSPDALRRLPAREPRGAHPLRDHPARRGHPARHRARRGSGLPGRDGRPALRRSRRRGLRRRHVQDAIGRDRRLRRRAAPGAQRPVGRQLLALPRDPHRGRRRRRGPLRRPRPRDRRPASSTGRWRRR